MQGEREATRKEGVIRSRLWAVSKTGLAVTQGNPQNNIVESNGRSRSIHSRVLEYPPRYSIGVGLESRDYVTQIQDIMAGLLQTSSNRTNPI